MWWRRHGLMPYPPPGSQSVRKDPAHQVTDPAGVTGLHHPVLFFFPVDFDSVLLADPKSQFRLGIRLASILLGDLDIGRNVLFLVDAMASQALALLEQGHRTRLVRRRIAGLTRRVRWP